ncbi:MAG: hypothetical protein IKR18_04065 [Bacteroidaceae bacterium]|nr:hypothetical protein [Bacteroidaceae bacterium]
MKLQTKAVVVILSIFLTASCSENVEDTFEKQEIEQVVYFNTDGSLSQSQTSETRILKDGSVKYKSEESAITATREATNANATTLSDVWVVQFSTSTGKFKNAQYTKIEYDTQGMPFARMKLSVDELGDASNLYYLVNSHNANLISYYPANETEFLSSPFLNQKVAGANWCDTLGVPMYAISKQKSILNTSSAIIFNDTITLKRLCAKVNFKIRTAFYSNTDRVHLNKIHLRNVPATFNFLERDTLDMSKVELTDFETYNWDDNDSSIYEETENGIKYLCKEFSWYVPYSYPSSADRRMYLEAWGESIGDYALFKFRIHDSKKSYNIHGNTVYSAIETLAGSAESGSEDDTYQVLNFENVSVIDASGEEKAANCYVCNTKLGNKRLFCFPIKQYNVYAEKYGDVDGVAPVSDATRWKAEKLWSTNTSCMDVEVLGYTGIGNGYVFVRVNPTNNISDMKDMYGNALIAIRDDNNKIMWSWHLWINPQNVLSDVYSFNGKQWLGRNLGAYKSSYVNVYNSYPANADEWKETIGLYYQWGRKDPFRGAYGKGVSDEHLLLSEGQTSTAYDSELVPSTSTSDCRKSSIASPSTFYHGQQWPGCGNETGNGDYSWITYTGEKSVFDPCPPGFRMPKVGDWGQTTLLNASTFAATGTWNYSSVYTNNGTIYPYRTYSLGTESFFFIPAGMRQYSNGNISDIGMNGMYWSGDALVGVTQYALPFKFDKNTISSNSNVNRSAGLCIRPVKE